MGKAKKNRPEETWAGFLSLLSAPDLASLFRTAAGSPFISDLAKKNHNFNAECLEQLPGFSGLDASLTFGETIQASYDVCQRYLDDVLLWSSDIRSQDEIKGLRLSRLFDGFLFNEASKKLKGSVLLSFTDGSRLDPYNDHKTEAKTVEKQKVLVITDTRDPMQLFVQAMTYGELAQLLNETVSFVQSSWSKAEILRWQNILDDTIERLCSTHCLARRDIENIMFDYEECPIPLALLKVVFGVGKDWISKHLNPIDKVVGLMRPEMIWLEEKTDIVARILFVDGSVWTDGHALSVEDARHLCRLDPHRFTAIPTSHKLFMEG